MGYIIQILNSRKNTNQQQIDQIQTPEILENHECHLCAESAHNPDTATQRMLTNDLLLQYTGGRQNEDHWNPPELQMQSIIQTHGNIQYALRSEISYSDRR